MKKIIKKVKGKKVLSFVLAAIMLATTFNIALPMLKLDAGAVEINGIKQERIVSNYATKYAEYAKNYLNGCSEPTNIVIPGLKAIVGNAADVVDYNDFVVQGLSYYAPKDWIMVSMYHNANREKGEKPLPSMIFAINAKTGIFEEAFAIKNRNEKGEIFDNTDHGGGLAFSEYNFYYSGDDSDKDTYKDENGNTIADTVQDADQIAYAPLSYFNNPKDYDGDGFVDVIIEGAIKLPEIGGAPTAYVCYDAGILWAGNFYAESVLGVLNTEYNVPVDNTYESAVFGYKLAGNSSEEEWNYLCGKYKNLINNPTASGEKTVNGGTCTWKAYKNADSVNVYGDITAPTAYVREFTSDFATANLKQGVNYTIEFTSTNNETDIYLFRQNESGGNGPHTNVGQSSQTTITQLQDGRYHYSMNFTAGTQPAGADSTWGTNPNYGYTGLYNIRFDQDDIQTGETRVFEISDIRIYETPISETLEEEYEGSCVGNPSHTLVIDKSVAYNIQYAVVEKGRLYLSRSYGVGETSGIVGGIAGGVAGLSEYSTLSIYDIDLSVPGTIPYKFTNANGKEETVYAKTVSNGKNFEFMPMSEGLCFINDYLYMSFEGASSKYLNEGQSYLIGKVKCPHPIDVVWKIDTYALTGQQRPRQVQTDHYQKITTVEQIEADEEYLIVYESEEKDPVTQKNILYALDAEGGLKGFRLPKANDTYNAAVGHPITEYEIKDGVLHLTNSEKDDTENLRWEIRKTDKGYNIRNVELYFSEYRNFYFDKSHIGMVTDDMSLKGNIAIQQAGDTGGFWIAANGGQYFLWCNEKLDNNYTDKINKYYARNGANFAMYSGLSEKAGTFHCDALDYDRNEAHGNDPNAQPNILGGPIETGADTNFAHGVFHIYKRIYDPCSETEKTRVYTDLNAKVEADGTYTVDIETYATSSTHYKVLGEKPTDYIFVLDASGSMTNNDDALGYKTESTWKDLAVVTAGGEVSTKDPGKVQVNGYEFHNNTYYKTADGVYHPVYVAVNTYKRGGSPIFNPIYQNFWCYYKSKTDNLYYMMYPDVREGAVATGMGGSVASTGITFAELQKKVDGNTDVCGSSSNYNATTRDDTVIYRGPHYTLNNITRLEAMKQSLVPFVDTIADKATASGLDHRISLVTFGSNDSDNNSPAYLNTGMYPNSGAAFAGYTSLGTTQYQNAFYNVGSFGNVKTAINSITTNIDDPDTYSNYGMEIAKNIVANTVGKDGNTQNYLTTGDRNLCVIMITDGIPGIGNDKDIANEVANGAIANAKDLKDKGAAVFTLQIGSNSLDGFDMNKYMDYVSSEYESVSSMTDIGVNNIKDIVYHLDVPTATFDLKTLTKDVFDQVTLNAKTDLAQLDNQSIIQQKLSDVFDTTNATASAKVQTGYYDAIGRLTFDDTISGTSITPQINKTTKVVTATGFNYAEKYITKEKTGEKLIISVTGLMPKNNVVFHNTSISNQGETGLYQDGTALTNKEYFKRFPERHFSVPEYTYALDYGLSLLDTDINGTLCAVSNNLSQQNPDNYNKSALNGDLAIQEGGKALLYSIDPGVTEKSGYTLINRPDGTYDWFKIKIVPASNIYFEENEITVEEENDSTISKWDTANGGTSATNRLLPSEEDPFGFDNAYNNTNAYSNGTALKTVVDETKESSEISTFTFTGTGFDLVSTCGPKTGVLAVSVKSSGKRVKSFMVDTYYDGSDKATLNQVPVISWSNGTSEAKTYEVSVMAIYLGNAGAIPKSGIKNNLIDTGLTINSAKPTDTKDAAKLLESVGAEEFISDDIEMVWFDDNSIFNGGTGVAPTKKSKRETGTTTETTVTLENYIDGFRVYNPLGANTSVYKDAEQNVSYVNVVKNLSKLSSESSTFGEIAYITSSLTGGTSLTFAKYQEVGPKDELYLKKDGGISFKVKVSGNEKVMLGLRAVNGETNVTINGGKPMSVTIKSATEMYYDISECITTTGEVTISVTNNGPKLIAVNHIKFSGGEQINTTTVSGVRSTTRSTDASAVETSKFLPVTQDDLVAIENSLNGEVIPAMVKNGVVVPIVEEEEIIPDDNTNTGDNNINDDTDTEGSENEEFSLFSLIEMLIAFIEKILYNAFGAGSIA